MKCIIQHSKTVTVLFISYFNGSLFIPVTTEISDRGMWKVTFDIDNIFTVLAWIGVMAIAGRTLQNSSVKRIQRTSKLFKELKKSSRCVMSLII